MPDSRFDATIEHEANVFARELLVPRKILRKEMNKLRKGTMGFSIMDDRQIGILADKFEAPIAVIVDQLRIIYQEDKDAKL